LDLAEIALALQGGMSSAFRIRDVHHSPCRSDKRRMKVRCQANITAQRSSIQKARLTYALAFKGKGAWHPSFMCYPGCVRIAWRACEPDFVWFRVARKSPQELVDFFNVTAKAAQDDADAFAKE
jgi:hypothetical protein